MTKAHPSLMLMVLAPPTEVYPSNQTVCHTLCHLYFSISSSQRIKIINNRDHFGLNSLIRDIFTIKVQAQFKSESVVALCCSVQMVNKVHSHKN